MFRLWTKVTTSPTAASRSSSATSRDGGHLGAPGGEQGDDLVLAHLVAVPNPVEDGGDRAGGRRRGRDQGRRVDLGPGVPVVVPAQRLGVAVVQHGEAEPLVQPAARVEGVLGIDRQARRQHVALGLGHLSQALDRGPGALGVDVVGGHRGHATPVVDAGVQQRAEVVGQVGRGLQVDLGRAGSAGPARSPPGSPSGGQGSALCMAVPAFGQEVLDDHLLHVAVATVGLGDGLEGLDPVLPGLADADEDPRRERRWPARRPPPGWPGDARAPCPASPRGPAPRPASPASSPGTGRRAAARPARRGRGRRRWRGGAGRSRPAPGGTWRPGSRRSTRSRARPATRGRPGSGPRAARPA